MLDAEKRALTELLTGKIKSGAGCPMCKSNEWTLVDGYFVNHIQDVPTTGLQVGKGLPTAVLCCTNCGFISQHALGILGLLPQANNGK
jgi:predicted Zn-ribbon and HTH transcriptional regulator